MTGKSIIPYWTTTAPAKFADMDYISLMSFPGRTGSVIYLHSYLSTMFQISDVLVGKEAVAMVLKINITLPDETIHRLIALSQSMMYAFQRNYPAFQNLTWKLSSQKWRKSLMHRGFPVSGAPNPYISYILYQTPAGKNIYPTYRRRLCGSE